MVIMSTIHKLINANSISLPLLDNSINLIVTSPPYPMIAMWDNLFCELDEGITRDLDKDGQSAYIKMHTILDKVWLECNRVLKDGGIICINIGDATRTIDNKFALYSNHSRIIRTFEDMGFTILPPIIWQKLSNAPNKFMGSGMLPTGAYVTQEHEYILIMRKGGLRQYTKGEEVLRRESAYFFEERNTWFADSWKIKGEGQKAGITAIRECKASYPFELPYRLINMFSLKGDTILDPFNGTGTTVLASMLSERNSIGIEIEPKFIDYVKRRSYDEFDLINKYVYDRYFAHIDYMANYEDKGIEAENHNFYVKTVQEKYIVLNEMEAIKWNGNDAQVTYREIIE